jgi:hypothetical protein
MTHEEHRNRTPASARVAAARTGRRLRDLPTPRACHNVLNIRIIPNVRLTPRPIHNILNIRVATPQPYGTRNILNIRTAAPRPGAMHNILNIRGSATSRHLRTTRNFLNIRVLAAPRTGPYRPQP